MVCERDIQEGCNGKTVIAGKLQLTDRIRLRISLLQIGSFDYRISGLLGIVKICNFGSSDYRIRLNVFPYDRYQSHVMPSKQNTQNISLQLDDVAPAI
jgi:hypothetical protein